MSVAGESERALQTLFRRARAAAPSIIFFDEVKQLARAISLFTSIGQVDAIACRRGGVNDSHTAERLLTQMLVEMDGVHSHSTSGKATYHLTSLVLPIRHQPL